LGGSRGRRVTLEIKQECLFLINEATANGCRLKSACQDLGFDFKTINRWKISCVDARMGPTSSPANKLTDLEKDLIVEVATSAPFMDLSPWQIVARLADEEIYIGSESSFYKILKERKLLVHRGKSKKAVQNKPEALVAKGPNQIWSWDITYLRGPIRGGFYYLYMFMDIFSRKIVGWEVHENESMEKSSRLVSRICREENINPHQLVLHADNGGSMKGATMLATLQKLGVVPSFSRPKVSDDNPFSESLFKTLKYCPQYPSSEFSSLTEACVWVKNFVSWYNNEHLHSGIKFVTPVQKHLGLDVEILNKRKLLYAKAREKNPNRWTGKTRNWDVVTEVYLNPLQNKKEIVMNIAS